MSVAIFIMSMLTGFFMGGTALFAVAWWMELKSEKTKFSDIKREKINAVLTRLATYDISFEEAKEDIDKIFK